MVRYFFHVSNGNDFNDQVGKDEVGYRFSDPEDAKAHAAVVARELAEDDDWDGYRVLVIDEHGNEIARVPIKDRDRRNPLRRRP
jgi:hypothetical protein